MTRVVVGLGALGIVVAVVVSLSHPNRTWLLSNGVVTAQYFRVLDPGETFCQSAGTIPAGTGTVRMLIGTHGDPGPALTVRYYAGRRVLTSGGVARGWDGGDFVDLSLRPLARTAESNRMCLSYEKGDARLALAGEGEQMSTQFYTAEKRTWWEQFGTLRHRFAAARSSWYGQWSLVVALVLAATGAALALAVAWRIR